MRKYRVNSYMFFTILTMSIVIFSFAFSASSFGSGKEKDVPFFSDGYFVCDAGAEDISIEDFIKTAGSGDISQIAFLDGTGGYRFVRLTEEFFDYLGLKKKDYGSRNVAFVNRAYSSQCYQEKNRWKINIQGNTYYVAAFYDEPEKANWNVCYINADSACAEKNGRYLLAVVDLPSEKKADVQERIMHRWPEMQISDWNGQAYGLTYFTDVYMLAAFICGVILCVNCSGFADMWLRSYRTELAIRRLAGADSAANHSFLIREYAKVFGGAAVAGMILLQIFFSIFRKMEVLSSVRDIFGERLKPVVFLLSSGIVFLITVIVLEFIYARFRRRTIAAEVSG